MRSSITRCVSKSVLAAAVIAVVASTAYLPETRLPVVIWLLSVALVWRPSAGREA